METANLDVSEIISAKRINEYTTDEGVTIEAVLIKDGKVDAIIDGGDSTVV